MDIVWTRGCCEGTHAEGKCHSFPHKAIQSCSLPFPPRACCSADTCGSGNRGSGQGLLGRLSPALVRLSPPRGQTQPQPRCVQGSLRLAWRGCRTGTGARAAVGDRARKEHAGLNRWNQPGAARDGPGNYWGSVSSAPGLGEGFLLGFLLLVHSSGLFSPWSAGSSSSWE